jgi:hypothetical protein
MSPTSDAKGKRRPHGPPDRPASQRMIDRRDLCTRIDAALPGLRGRRTPAVPPAT